VAGREDTCRHPACRIRPQGRRRSPAAAAYHGPRDLLRSRTAWSVRPARPRPARTGGRAGAN